MSQRTFRILLGIGLGVLSASSLTGQVYPLSENVWTNPEFVERFRGSYGVATDKEPTVTPEEATVFEEITPMLQQGNFQAAANRLRQAIMPESSAALDYTLGNIYLQMQRNQEAIRQFRTAIQKFPNFMRAYRNLGIAYLQNQEWQQAIQMFTKALELGDAQGDTYGFIGFSYLNMENYDSALGAYEQAIVLDPDNRDWKIGKAQALLATERWREAAGLFQQLIENGALDENYFMSLANAYVALQELEKASGVLETMRRLNMATTDSLMLLGDIYINRGIPRLAAKVYSQAVQKGGQQLNVSTVEQKAGILVSRAAFDEAEQLIQTIRESYGDLPEELNRSLTNVEAQIALGRGQKEEAAQILQRLLEIDPMNGRALLLLANYNWREGNYEEADFYFTRAQKLNDFQIEALIDNARMKVEQNKFTEAVGLLTRAQSIRPDPNVERYLDAVRNAARASS